MSTKKHGWVKWGFIAACICFVIIAALSIPKLVQQISQSAKQRLLISYLQELNMNAEKISSPVFFSTYEMPALSKEQVIESIQNNTTILGTVSSIDCASIKDDDKTWFITAIDITIDDVLTGIIDSDTAHVVCAATYSGVADSQMVPINAVPDIREGMKAAFVLSKLSGEPWEIAGKEVDPHILGDFYIVYKLDYLDDVLTYSEQNISVSLSEIK